jgi:transcriptional antiterminator RfaH
MIAAQGVAEESWWIDDACAPWFAVHTQPAREEVAEANLRRFCRAVFCPRYRQRAIIHGYRREVVRPLFPGYLFAAFDPAQHFKAVHYAGGVRGVVAFGGQPAQVPPSLLHGIWSRMRDGFVVIAPPPLCVGQRVEITAGPLKGYTGIFTAQCSGSERVAVLLDTLTYNANAIMDRAAVRALA